VLTGVVAEVLTVKTAVPEPPVIDGGTKAHVGAGVTTGVMLLQDRFTVPVKPFRAAMVMVEVAVPAAATEAGASGVAVRVKSGPGLTVKPTGKLWLNDPDVPVTVTLDVAIGVVELVVMVRADVTAVPVGVTGLGAKPQLVPAGRLGIEQVSATALLKPFTGVTEIVYAAGLPAVTV
jgi:hypothetical protein